MTKEEEDLIEARVRDNMRNQRTLRDDFCEGFEDGEALAKECTFEEAQVRCENAFRTASLHPDKSASARALGRARGIQSWGCSLKRAAERLREKP